jgi:phosphatidylglycerophosphatase A
VTAFSRFSILFIATGAFTGYFPVASGTVGTLVAVPLYLLWDGIRPASGMMVALLFGVLVLAACKVAGMAETLLKEHDSHKIVVDEIVGYLAATLLLPPTWGNIVAAFLLFRFFDIVKPFPAGYIDEHGPGGYGVVLDDVVSGIYANIAIRIFSVYV